VLELNPEGRDPVILTHGLFMSIAAFFFSIAPALAEEHRLILYDLRGHGRSSRRDEAYTPAALSEDLLCLMDALELPEAHLAAYSYGGTVVLHTALHHPERVRRLAMVESAFVDIPLYESLMGEDDTTTHINRDLEVYTELTGVSVTEAQAERMRTLIAHIFADDERREEMFRANQRLEEEAKFMTPQAPTLLLYGDQSPFLDMAREMTDRYPTASLAVVEGDHNLLEQQMGQIGKILAEFFD
jgi:pimeloyl-ACP methyl ester carboxylesterase